MPAANLFFLANLLFCLGLFWLNIRQLTQHRRRLGIALGWLANPARATQPDGDPDALLPANIVTLQPAAVPAHASTAWRRLAA